jgi:hypothetical protein
MARNVDGVDAKLAFGDLNTHERFFSLVQLRQCSITGFYLVDIGSPQRGLPDVDLGVRGRSPGGRRHENVVTDPHVRTDEAGERELAAVGAYADQFRFFRSDFEDARRQVRFGAGVGRNDRVRH